MASPIPSNTDQFFIPPTYKKRPSSRASDIHTSGGPSYSRQPSTRSADNPTAGRRGPNTQYSPERSGSGNSVYYKNLGHGINTATGNDNNYNNNQTSTNYTSRSTSTNVYSANGSVKSANSSNYSVTGGAVHSNQTTRSAQRDDRQLEARGNREEHNVTSSTGKGTSRFESDSAEITNSSIRTNVNVNSKSTVVTGTNSVKKKTEVSGLDPAIYQTTAIEDIDNMSTPLTIEIDNTLKAEGIEMEDVGSKPATSAATKKKRKFLRKPKRNSKLDKIITFLEDKRIKDDELDQLQDLQMPGLRKVLNIIFVTLGMCFLLAVLGVIIYTTIANEDGTFR